MIISTTHDSFSRFILSHTDCSHDPQHSYRAENEKWDFAAENEKWDFFLPLEIILQTMILGKLVFKFLSN